MSNEEQRAIFDPVPPPSAGKKKGRKLILATSIVETSVTLPGVRFAVDSGLTKKPSPTGLVTTAISQRSVKQRAGRVGVAPGQYYGLYSEATYNNLPLETRASILDADLAPVLLSLFKAGIKNISDFEWFRKLTAFSTSFWTQLSMKRSPHRRPPLKVCFDRRWKQAVPTRCCRQRLPVDKDWPALRRLPSLHPGRWSLHRDKAQRTAAEIHLTTVHSNTLRQSRLVLFERGLDFGRRFHRSVNHNPATSL